MELPGLLDFLLVVGFFPCKNETRYVRETEKERERNRERKTHSLEMEENQDNKTERGPYEDDSHFFFLNMLYVFRLVRKSLKHK